MKWIAVLLCLGLCGCSKNIDNQESAQKAVDQYFSGRADLKSMSARVANVIFRGEEADATVMVTANGSPANTAIPIPYTLVKKSGAWVVKGPARGSMAGHVPQNGGAMPGGTVPGGTMPGGAMPAGHPDMSGAPGSANDPSAGHSELPPDHPPVGNAK